VWDLGANTGAYTSIAAESGREVIAIDADPVAVERLYLAVRSGALRPVLPVLNDLANPSPALGWRLVERRSLVDRGPAPVVMALALVHHLAIAGNVPLVEIGRFLAEIASEVIVEFVPKDDPQVRAMLTGRRDVFPDYSLDGFSAAIAPRYEVVESTRIEDSDRVVLHLRRHDG
jgi:ribosomal protein L11 methylase PrmA